MGTFYVLSFQTLIRPSLV